MRETEGMEGIEGDTEMQSGMQNEITEEDCNMGNEENREKGEYGHSYKSILTGMEEENMKEKTEEEQVSDDETEEKDSEEDDDYPIIKLSKKEKVRLRKPWKQSLIIKVMGRKVGYAYLLRRLNIIWHPKSRMELITLENDYFLVKY